MSVNFHRLEVAEVIDETADARSIRFAVPETLRETFAFKPGQHVTLRAEIDGEEVRRNYSLCVAPQDGEHGPHRPSLVPGRTKSTPRTAAR